MSGIKYGDCSPDVENLQKLLNRQFGYKVKATGEMDDATVQAVNDLKGKIGIQNSSRDVNNATLLAIEDAAIPRTLVEVNGKKAWVTPNQLRQLKAKAGAQAAAAIQPYVSMANEVKILWKAHETARKDNWFWSTAVDFATKAKFPSKGEIGGAVMAAKKMQKDAKNLTLDPAQLSTQSKPIRDAFAAMDQYRETVFGGGKELVKNLTIIRDTAAATLSITAGIATAGASWQVQVGVGAGVAAYDQTLKEVDRASTTANYSVGGGVSRVFVTAAVDGTIGLLMKGGKLGDYLDDVAKKAVEKYGSKLLLQYAIKAANGGVQSVIENSLKRISGFGTTGKKLDFDALVNGVIDDFIKGAGLKILGPLSKKYAKGAGAHFDLKDFKGLGKIDLDKTGEEAVKTVISAVAPTVFKATLEPFKPGPSPKDFEPKLRKAILAHPKVKAALKKAAKKK
ncbi:MAG: hypothetical protein AB8B60_20935 [Sulfitobacter sp.]